MCKFIVGILLAVSVVGCDNGEKSVAADSSASGNGSDVLVAIGSRRYTKGDLNKDISFRTGYYKYMDPKCTDQDLLMIRMKAAGQLVPAFIQNAIVTHSFDCYAKTNGVFAIPVETIRKEIEQKYVEAKQGVKDFPALLADMKKLGILEQFSKNIDNEVKTEALIRNVYSNVYPIGKLEIRRFHASVVATNRDSVRTNALIAAQMTNVVQALRKGGDFNALHDKYDMTPDFAKVEADYEWIAADFKDSPGVWEKLLSMKVGETTDIVDAIDSWHIYRIDDVIPANKSSSGEEAFHLSRIYFRRAGTFDPYTDDEVRKALEPIRHEKLLKLITAFELKYLKIDYPNGVDYFNSDEFKKLNGYIERVKEFYTKVAKDKFPKEGEK